MKKGLFLSFVTTLLIMSGCSNKAPSVGIDSSSDVRAEDDNTKNQNNSQEIVRKVVEETVYCDKVDNIAILDNSSLAIDKKDIFTGESDKETKKVTEITSSKDALENAKNIYFNFDQYNINSVMLPKIEYNAQIFSIDSTKYLKVKVGGNCDEWGSDEYNYALGLKRAKSVKDSLIAEGIDSDRFVLISYGESNPSCQEHTKLCWSKNRRADFELLP